MVGIILYGSFELAPYAKKYMNILENAKIPYDLIGWRREEKAQYFGENVYVYEGKAAKRYSSPFAKIMPATGYRRYVKKLLKKKKYDSLIILTTQTALILCDVLLTRYRNKFIFDYRDKSYEYVKPYGMLVNAVIKASRETVISSEWFKNNLTDKKEYILAHNFQEDFLKYRKKACVKRKDGEKIRVGYIGALRSFDYHKHLIDCFGNDRRFEFHICGCGDDVEKLRAYARNFDNIFVHGVYLEEDKYSIIENFDIMCYNYPYSYVNDGAVANKYYDALIMKKPMFVNPKTLLGAFIERENLGVGVDEESLDISGKIYDWYKNFDTFEFSKKCDFYMDKYIAEDKLFREKIKETLV